MLGAFIKNKPVFFWFFLVFLVFCSEACSGLELPEPGDGTSIVVEAPATRLGTQIDRVDDEPIARTVLSERCRSKARAAISVAHARSAQSDLSPSSHSVTVIDDIGHGHVDVLTGGGNFHCCSDVKY